MSSLTRATVLAALTLISTAAANADECRHPCEVFSGNELGLPAAELGAVTILAARDRTGVAQPLNVQRCESSAVGDCPSGRESLAVFLDYLGRTPPPVPAEIRFSDTVCLDETTTSFPHLVRISLTGHVDDVTLTALDPLDNVIATKFVGPGEMHEVEFQHAGTIASVQVLGHEVCIHEVCWDCDPLPALPFVRGDANADESIDVSDVVFVLSFLFGAGPQPLCDDAADGNDDGRIDLSDPVYVLLWLFGNRPLPPPPNHCGDDPTQDALGCASFPPCEPVLLVDQCHVGQSGASFACGTSGTPLFQSLTTGATNVAAVSLPLRAGGSFPSSGTNTTIRLRSGTPTGPVLATSSAFVDVSIASPSDPPGVRFRISPPVAVSPGDVLVIEWLSPAPAGVQPGTILSWMGEASDSYPGGMNFSGCAGDPLPRPDRDLYFKTYSQ